MTNKISNADRHQECMWFTEIDEWYNSSTSARNQIPASATLKILKDVIPSTPPFQITIATTPNSTTTSTQDKKKKVQKNIQLFLKYIVGNSGVFLSSYQESTNILKDMHKNFDTLLEKF